MAEPTATGSLSSPESREQMREGLDPPNESQHALDDLIRRALAYGTGPELKALFEFIRRFPHIAPYNAMLLHVQNPGIGYALRARIWESDYRRRIKPGARPYVILQIMGPVAFVFDLSDTEPIDPAVDLIPEAAKNPFPTTGEPPPGTIEKLTSSCSKIEIEVELRDRGTNLAGSVQYLPNRTPPFHVLLNVKHTKAQQLGTLAHELAHIFCGHLGYRENGFWRDRRNTSITVREFEAEAVAYLAMLRYNLDIGSVPYLAGYLKAESLPAYSLETILKSVGKIEDMIAGRFRSKKKPKK